MNYRCDAAWRRDVSDDGMEQYGAGDCHWTDWYRCISLSDTFRKRTEIKQPEIDSINQEMRQIKRSAAFLAKRR